MKFKKIYFYLIAFIILSVACTSGISEKRAKEMLDIVLKDDMSAIIDGIDTSGIMKEPYYEYREFKSFEEGKYQYLAVVDFYFLKDIKRKIVRKYRFNKLHLQWERFENVWEIY